MTPRAVTVAGMYALGVRNFEVGAAFDSLVRQATVPNPAGLSDYGCPGQCAGMRPNLAAYEQLHYAPQDDVPLLGRGGRDPGGLHRRLRPRPVGEEARPGRRGPAVHRTRRLLAEHLQPARPRRRPATSSPASRTAPGLAPFDLAGGVGFAQGTSATYTWMVQHDVHRLSALMGGDRVAAARLDDFFRTDDGSWAVTPTPDGYDPTNEPGIHIPWLYNALGQPWKTQQTVRTYMDLVYGTGPAGLPGNDDLGTMSAWYVWGALGMYPQTPSRGEMLLSSPTFRKVWIRRAGGPTTTVTAPGASAKVRLRPRCRAGRTHLEPLLGPGLAAEPRREPSGEGGHEAEPGLGLEPAGRPAGPLT